MLKQGTGRIVNVSARAAVEGKDKMAPYCISKSAIVTLTESLAAEHKSNDININCVLPGTIDTPTNRSDMPNADFTTWVPTEDIANTMLYLSSELANSVNGAIVPVYGKS
jgi:NAD(P)-dependent dehydrogenase (short-subunit alcohol dehydrogenase family)